MSQYNPYQAPQVPQPQPMMMQPMQQMSGGLWRQGKVLVLHKNAPLPDICLKSNQPATRRLKRRLQWHHPAVALSILAGLLIYVILAMVLTKRATIFIALTDEWFAIRRRRLAIAWGIVLLSILIGFAAFGMLVTAPSGQGSGFGCVGCSIAFVLFLAGIIYGNYAARMVRPACITEQYVYLLGVHPDFLAKLPEWTYPGRI
jgi:hypothetical protein